MAKPDYKALLTEAKNETPRQSDGTWPYGLLRDALALKRPPVDPAEEARKWAEKLIKDRMRPGTTAPEGQLSLPGLESYAYEPDRLIKGNGDDIIEQKDARSQHKMAQAKRSRTNAQNVVRRADIDQAEAEGLASWTIEGLSNHRPRTELTFGNYVHEENLWSEESEDDE